MIDIKKLTNRYLNLLAQSDIDSNTYAEIHTFLKDKIDSSTPQAPTDRGKAALTDKLAGMPGVDKIEILDERGFQIDGLDIRDNGMGPVTILIIGEGE